MLKSSLIMKRCVALRLKADLPFVPFDLQANFSLLIHEFEKLSCWVVGRACRCICFDSICSLFIIALIDIDIEILSVLLKGGIPPTSAHKITVLTSTAHND